MKKKRSGFSLIEIMIVVVIIGLMAGTVTLVTKTLLDRAKRNKAKGDIGNLVNAVELFYTDNSRYPNNDEGLGALASGENRYIARLVKDPWSRDYQYLQPGRSGAYDIISYGADGREGGTGADADITIADLDRQDKAG